MWHSVIVCLRTLRMISCYLFAFILITFDQRLDRGEEKKWFVRRTYLFLHVMGIKFTHKHKIVDSCVHVDPPRFEIVFSCKSNSHRNVCSGKLASEKKNVVEKWKPFPIFPAIFSIVRLSTRLPCRMCIARIACTPIGFAAGSAWRVMNKTSALQVYIHSIWYIYNTQWLWNGRTSYTYLASYTYI